MVTAPSTVARAPTTLSLPTTSRVPGGALRTAEGPILAPPSTTTSPSRMLPGPTVAVGSMVAASSIRPDTSGTPRTYRRPQVASGHDPSDSPRGPGRPPRRGGRGRSVLDHLGGRRAG